ncbi:hypothetical protein pb186bvf_009496 [Paramecium bursaria]
MGPLNSTKFTILQNSENVIFPRLTSRMIHWKFIQEHKLQIRYQF